MKVEKGILTTSAGALASIRCGWVTLFTRSLEPEISGQFLVLSEFPHFERPMVVAAPTYSTIYVKKQFQKS